jgi:hypothetical protein
MRMRVWHNSLIFIAAKNILTAAAEKSRTHIVYPVEVFRLSYLATLFQRVRITKTRIRTKMIINDEHTMIWKKAVMDSGVARLLGA